MARPKNEIPQYRRHAPSNTARCWVDGRWVALGRYNSPESRAEYARLLAERRSPSAPAASSGRSDVTVNEIILGFWRFAEGHYRRADGTPTNELPQYRQTFRLVRGLYGNVRAAEFGPLALKACVQTMIDAGWCRNLINQRIGRVKRLFKWAASEQLVPASIWHALTSVPGLQQGRTSAKEREPVRLVEEDVVTATLPCLGPAVRAMVELQLLTGMRPGEVCRLRPLDVDATGPVWLYRPTQYKSKHRGKARVVALGPKAQAVLRPFTPAACGDHFFSPERAVESFHRDRTAKRKSNPSWSGTGRNAVRPRGEGERRPGGAYTVTSYGRAIARAIKRANRARPGEGNGETRRHLIPHWHPNQLRHTHGTRVRHRFGLEAAQVALGHERADVTQVYAEKNAALAMRIAAEMG